MIKLVAVFVVAFASFFVGISALYYSQHQTKVDILRILTYSGICAVLAVALLVLIVLLF